MKHVNFLAILITLIFSSNTLFAQELKITVSHWKSQLVTPISILTEN